MALSTLPAQEPADAVLAACRLFTDANSAAHNARMLGRLLQDAAGNFSLSEPLAVSQFVDQVMSVTTAVEAFLDEVSTAACDGEQLLESMRRPGAQADEASKKLRLQVTSD